MKEAFGSLSLKESEEENYKHGREKVCTCNSTVQVQVQQRDWKEKKKKKDIHEAWAAVYCTMYAKREIQKPLRSRELAVARSISLHFVELESPQAVRGQTERSDPPFRFR